MFDAMNGSVARWWRRREHRASAGGRSAPFARVSLARQYVAASAAVLLVGVLAAGSWISERVERSVVNRTAQIAAAYFESALADCTDELVGDGTLPADALRALDRLFIDGPLARKVVRFKLWSLDGRIRYSDDHEQIGRVFVFHDHHAIVLSTGRMLAAITDLDGPDNAPERRRWNRLMEIYLPVRARGSPQVRAIAEFYHALDDVDADIFRGRRESWTVLGAGALVLYALLLVPVLRASRTIAGQQLALRREFERQAQLLEENRAMHRRLQTAGEMTTAMTEASLRRTAADLHDGPIQDLAFALLRLDEVGLPNEEAARLRDCLQRAMASLRETASGLIVPAIEETSLADAVRRAVSDSERKSGVTIEADIDDRLGPASEALKITVYRVVREALANSARHAPGKRPRVTARADGDAVEVEVADDGPGFDARRLPGAGHLGLALLRERVQLLSGRVDLRSVPGRGTTLRVRLPLSRSEDHDG